MELFHAKIAHVIDPNSFWLQLGTTNDFEKFKNYEGTLADYYNETKDAYQVKFNDLQQGEKVLVAAVEVGALETSISWRRAQVARIEKDMVDVFYIDLGYTEMVTIDKIFHINQELFDHMPRQAIRVGLAGIKPLTRSWTTRAISLFEKEVLDKNLVASLIEYDEVQDFGIVILYALHEDKWISLTQKMIDDELGLTNGLNIKPTLSKAEVEQALRASEELHKQADSSKESGANYEDTDDTDNQCNDVVDNTDTPYDDSSNVSPLQYPSINALIPPIDVPAFDFNTLMQTRSIFLSKMQEDKESESRLHLQTKLSQETSSTELMDQTAGFTQWAPSDLLVGQAHAFNDVHEDITKEIYKCWPSHAHETDDIFLGKTKTSKTPVVPTKIPTQKVTPQPQLDPLTEQQQAELQTLIIEILVKNSEEASLLCLLHDVVQPDTQIPIDKLIAVVTAMIEAPVLHSSLNPSLAFEILETYLVTESSQAALITVLDRLKDKYLKNPNAKKVSKYHERFSLVLATAFLHEWPKNICHQLKKYILMLLERWVVFNKQRVQDSAEAMFSEQMYLECVDTVVSRIYKVLAAEFPDNYGKLLEEMRYKLLHDASTRGVRVLLLDLLLKVHIKEDSVAPVVHHVSTQTEDKTGTSSSYPKVGQVQTVQSSQEQPASTLNVETYSPKVKTVNNPPVVDSTSGNKEEKKRNIPKSVMKILKQADDPIVKLVKENASDWNIHAPEFVCDKTAVSATEAAHSVGRVVKSEPAPKKRIKYSLEELVNLNPYPEGGLTVKEPYELSYMFRLSEPPVSSHQGSEPNSQTPTAAEKPDTRDSPTITLGPKSNFINWKPLSDLLPKSNLTAKQPSPSNADVSKSNSTLKDLAKELLGTAGQGDSFDKTDYKPETAQKKKKSKFHPIDEPVKAEEDADDLLSPEALQMYEELEKEQRSKPTGIPKVIHPSRQGSTSGSTSSRSSLFASVRNQQKEPQGTWMPRRWCTRCGSEQHIISDCPEDITYEYSKDPDYNNIYL
ncbi:uncharacterized protein LOC131953750 [Physella acuta]|uniref:uncharacterized protein LOC131953750 n=1 Tax=Physella acuta TaxID=109671 RepID=UPI0027DDC5E4|nr:uncharacterized protein LOC131953750 [Physella acuta]XP_059173094.1 uncharacterized protein LOC131953750 [Physella acuta]